ncbi:MAG: glycosyltransferase [Actinomycetota bacterium]|nr:glycosyltransferase [Actinomycetota bacterium]
MSKFEVVDEITRKGTNRVVIYSHDTYGLGHLRRNIALAEALVKSSKAMRIVIVTGSRVASSFETPSQVELVELPPVVKVGVDEYEAQGIKIPISLIKRARAAIIIDVIKRFSPEIFYVDHSPLGMGQELRPVLDFLTNKRPSILRYIGLRDIIDSPENIKSGWGADGQLEAISTLYNRAFVFGERHLFDLAQAYHLSGTGGLHYLSYIGKPEFIEAGKRRSETFSDPNFTGGHLLVTSGGGGDGLPLCELGVKLGVATGHKTIVVTGPLMDKEALARLMKLAEGHSNIEVIEFCTNFEALVAKARVALSMGGYNTTLELAAARVPTIYLPRTYPRQEQLVRALIFEGLGFGSALTIGDQTLESVRELLDQLWRRPILDEDVTLEMSAIPRFASQIVVPSRYEGSKGSTAENGCDFTSPSSSVTSLNVEMGA